LPFSTPTIENKSYVDAVMPRLIDLHKRLLEDDGETELSLATSCAGTTFKLK
jgi:hypothetical protein